MLMEIWIMLFAAFKTRDGVFAVVGVGFAMVSCVEKSNEFGAL